jgi:hypothetical protein
MRVSSMPPPRSLLEIVAAEVVEMQRGVAIQHLLEELLQKEERVLEERAILQGEAADLSSFSCSAVRRDSRGCSARFPARAHVDFHALHAHAHPLDRLRRCGEIVGLAGQDELPVPFSGGRSSLEELHRIRCRTGLGLRYFYLVGSRHDFERGDVRLHGCSLLRSNKIRSRGEAEALAAISDALLMALLMKSE